MSTKAKLLERFKTQPKDFTFDELETMLKGLGFELTNKGKTSGSRAQFINVHLKGVIDIHKPHTSGEPVKEVVIKEIKKYLISINLI
jgi:hypothetical protein